MKSWLLPLLLALLAVTFSITSALADYTLVLKNGRRITVEKYREESGMIKFHGLGGEIGISKDQIQAIQKDSNEAGPSLSLTTPESAPSVATKEPAAEEKKISPPIPDARVPRVEESLAEQKAKEEKEYLKRVEEITQQIKERRERYGAETTGITGPDPGFFTTEEAYRRYQDDLISRLRDAQRKPPVTGPEGVSVPVPGYPPPPYTERQKALSDLRNQINQLESERQRLIEEMKHKNFATGSLFLE